MRELAVLPRRFVLAWCLVVAATTMAHAQTPAAQTPQTQQPVSDPATQAPLPSTTFRVTVVGTTPLPGISLPPDQLAAPVQVATAADLDASGALDLSDFLVRRATGVHVNQTQGNPFQPDVSFRGYTASPLLGTPQGLSVYLDGVRLNQPFGEVVSWDLIPGVALLSSVLMPGSNPLFGLNTLGGAIALETKDGRNSPGTSILASYGSDLRRAVEFEHGGSQTESGIDWYLAGTLFAEDGWRDESPSDVRQIFGKLGWAGATRDIRLTVAHAETALHGNGLQESGFLDERRASAYTLPDITDNRSTLVNLAARRDPSPRVTVAGNAYYRRIGTDTLNGDLNEESLEEAFAPGAADEAFPLLLCLDEVQEQDPDSAVCTGLVNRTDTLQHNAGASAQITVRRLGRGNQLTAGAAFDRSRVDFLQSTELGYLDHERRAIGTGVFDEDDAVELDGAVRSWSLFATDTLSLAEAWHLTVSGRFNRTEVDNRDRLAPGGGPGSLTATHHFTRFNPAAGVTYSPTARVNLYLGYSEGSRAPASIELGCADPETPCKLPNAMAGDPPLQQVVTKTWESGVRGEHAGVDWRIGVFHATNEDDILFVASERTGFGYFTNVDRTRRRGVELGASMQVARATVGVNYTFLDATFQSEETLNGESNSSAGHDEGSQEEERHEGTIEIRPGNRIPLVPRHLFKAFGSVEVARALTVELGVTTSSSSYARGNENNLHEPDGASYLGAGLAPGYTVVNLGARHQLTPWLQLVGQIDNLLDRRYVTSAQLGPMGFTPSFTFNAGADQHATFFSPGAPRRAWIGTRLTF